MSWHSLAAGLLLSIPASQAVGKPDAMMIGFADEWHDGHTARKIAGFEPKTGSGYPVYIWIAGTGMAFNGTTNRDMMQRMTELGAVSAECAYQSFTYPLSCGDFESKADALFNSSNLASCVSRVCSREKADCSKGGLAVHGHSQGAQLASLARYYASDVSAAFVQGNGNNPNPFEDLSQCMNYYIDGKRNPKHGLDQKQVRSLVGEHDTTFSCCYDRMDEGCCWRKRTGREQQLDTTGYACPVGERNCLQPDGSGWYMVSDADAVKSQGANHCFSWSGGCIPPHDSWNPAYLGNCTWCLDSNLQWLHATAKRYASGNTAAIIV